MTKRWATSDAHYVADMTGEAPKADVVNNGERPSTDHYPVINPARVHGHQYTPYKGRTDWDDMANEQLSTIAQRNFATGRR